MTVSTIAKPQVGPDPQRAELDRPRQPLDPQTSAAHPRTSPNVQFSLKIRILYLGVFRWTNPNGGQNGGQTHSQTKQRGLLSSRLCVVLMPSTIARGGGPRSGAVGTTKSASEESPSEEPSVDCRRVPDDEACRRTAQPDQSFGDLSGAERRLDPLEPEPAEPSCVEPATRESHKSQQILRWQPSESARSGPPCRDRSGDGG